MLHWPLAGLYKNIHIHKPVFLLGNQGDGITFISRILRRNRDVVSISGNSNYWTGADEMATVLELFLPPRLRLAGRLVRTDPDHPQFFQPRSWSYGSDDLYKQYHLTEHNKPSGREINAFRLGIQMALKRFGNSDSRFVDKSQVYTLKTRFIQEILKDSDPNFVLFTRDPYISCYRAASGKAGDMSRYSSFLSFDERFNVCMEHWKNCMRTVLDDSHYLKNFKWLSLESYIKNIEEKTKELCTFLELSFEESMLPSAEQVIPFGTKYAERWFPVQKTVNEKYIEKIPARYFDQAEEYLGDTAALFGYHHPKKKLINETGHPGS
jgi:hypothetical protein